MTEPRLDHIAIATPDLDTGSAPYRTLGLHPEGPDEDVPTQGVRIRAYQVGDTLIELLTPTRPDSPIATFLEKRGPGLHHIAFRVDNLDTEITRLKTEGAHLLNDTPRPGRAGTRVIFTHPKWGAGTLIELVEHPNGANH